MGFLEKAKAKWDAMVGAKHEDASPDRMQMPPPASNPTGGDEPPKPGTAG